MTEENNLEKDLSRSLNRLQTFMASNNLPEIIPALFYTNDLLKQYAANNTSSKIQSLYFEEFKQQVHEFTQRDFGILKQHQQQTIDDILNHTNSDLYMNKIKSINNVEKSLQKVPQSLSKTSFSNGTSSTTVKNLNHSQANLISRSLSTEENEDKNLQIEKEFHILVKAYEEHRIDEAFSLKSIFLQKNYPLTAEQKDLFSTIELEYNTMISFYKQFDQDGWIFDKEENGVRLDYKIYHEEKQIAIKIESEFDVSIENFLAIITEIDLMGEYVPFTYDTKELKTVSRNEKIGTSKVYIPLLTDREIYFYAAGYDRIKENGSVFVFSKTINDDKVYQKKYAFNVPEKSDYVRLEYIFFIVEYIPITKKRAKVRLASRVDLKMNYLPQWILNKSARTFSFNYFKNMIKVNKNFKGSDWEKKVKQNPNFYNFFKSKIDEYIEKNLIH